MHKCQTRARRTLRAQSFGRAYARDDARSVGTRIHQRFEELIIVGHPRKKMGETI
jgi:hypothetical protein